MPKVEKTREWVIKLQIRKGLKESRENVEENGRKRGMTPSIRTFFKRPISRPNDRNCLGVYFETLDTCLPRADNVHCLLIQRPSWRSGVCFRSSVVIQKENPV
jgi:hypothetical protein